MMAQNKKNNSITIANVIAIIGLVALLVFNYLGYAYRSGGETGWDIVFSLLITAFCAFLLWFMIKAKGAANNLEKWKIIEYVTLTIYIVVAIPLSSFGIMHFFAVNDKKEEVKALMQNDLQKIDKMFTDYKSFMSVAISATGTGLKEATAAGQVCDEKLNKFMEENRVSHTTESAANFERLQKTKLVGAGFETFYQQYIDEKTGIESAVNGWNIILVPRQAKLMEEIAASAQDELTKLSEDARLPVIKKDNGRHTITEFQKQMFNIEGGIESFGFKKALKKSGFSITAIVVILLIHIFILFNYIVAHRALTLGINKKTEEDGGKAL